MSLSISAMVERWPVDGAFIISRGAKTFVDVIVCTISDSVFTGQGEATAIYYQGETAEDCAAAINRLGQKRDTIDRAELQAVMPAGAARNAVDCALWDLECQKTGTSLWQRASLPEPKPLVTAFTISLNHPDRMEADAKAAAKSHPLLKIKLSGDNDRARVAAVHRGAPKARLIVDANESWDAIDIGQEASLLADLGVELIEQPVSAGRDELLADVRSPIPLCADESCHDSQDIPRLARFYDAVNVKLDKTGGLTEAIALCDAADNAGLHVLVGCMLSTSLAIRPAFALAQRAQWVDLDGPLLLEQDRPGGMDFTDGLISEVRETGASR